MRRDRAAPGRLAAEPPPWVPESRAEPAPVADRRRFDVVVWLLAPITLILCAAALKLSAAVTLPLALAYFLAVLVQPLQVWLRARLPRWLRWLAVPLTMLTVVAVLAFAISLLSVSVEPVISRGPDYAQRFQDWLQSALGWGRAHGIQLPQAGELGGSSLGALAHRLPTGLNLVGGTLGFAVLIFFFALLMLIESDGWQRKAEAAFGHSEEMREAGATIGHKVRWYLLIRSCSGAISGLLVGLWLWLLGVDFALLWGVMFFLLNYVPTVGSIVAGILGGPGRLPAARAGLGGGGGRRHARDRPGDRQLPRPAPAGPGPRHLAAGGAGVGGLLGLDLGHSGDAAGGADDRDDHHPLRAGPCPAAGRDPDERHRQRPRARLSANGLPSLRAASLA